MHDHLGVAQTSDHLTRRFSPPNVPTKSADSSTLADFTIPIADVDERFGD
jgi:hypothetical protein